MRYGVVIEKAGNNYSAFLPDLRGCVATRESVEQTERNIRDAIRFYLDGLREDGLPIPEAATICDYVEA